MQLPTTLPTAMSRWPRRPAATEVAISGSDVPTATMFPTGDAKALKESLDGAGVTVTTEGTEQHDGAEAYHLTVATDTAQLFASSYLENVSAAEIASAKAALEGLKLDIDVWIETSSNHVVEVDVAGTSTTDSSQSMALTVKLGDPDGSISTEAPASFVEIPMDAIMQNVMQLFIGQDLAGG